MNVEEGVTVVFKAEADLGPAERREWSYSPAVAVGPLRFRMTLDEVVKAAETLGQTKVSDCPKDHAIFSPTWKVDLSRGEVVASPPVVTAYVSQAVGLFCVSADAAHGPQIAYAGIPLVGRDLADLERDTIAYAEAHDVCIRYTPEGYAGPDDPGIVLRVQRVGQVLRSRPLFMVTRDGANTEWDSIPSEERRLADSSQPDVL